MSLQYYRAEAKRFPWHSTTVVSSAATILDICEKFFMAGFNAPAIRIKLDIATNSQSAGRFEWNWFTGYSQIRYQPKSTINTVLHELAHYLDFLDRQAQIKGLMATKPDYNTCTNAELTKYHKTLLKIRKAHWHSAKHAALMVRVVAWFDSNFSVVTKSV
jgi:hypothetical protein